MASDPHNRPITPMAGAVGSYIHGDGKIGVLVELGVPGTRRDVI
jgi:translation elongation factor EF-Ts